MKSRSTQIVIAAVAVLAISLSLARPNTALAAAPQHHDQAPGFYRLKVGDLEVTTLYDGTGAFDPHWLNGTKATIDGVAKALHEDPHMLDVADTGFLVNTGKQLILVDVGAGTWWGGGAFGRLGGSLRSAGYTPEEVDIVLVTHLHSDHVGGLTTQDGKRVFPNADVYVAKAESDFWLSPEIAAKAPKASAKVGDTRAPGFFRESDIVTIHLVLSHRTRGIVGRSELISMKATAYLVNAARGPIVDEGALVEILKAGKIAGAALDVFNIEPLPPEHPFRQLPNVLATPHLGYGSRSLYATFYRDSVENIKSWIWRDQTDRG